MNRRNTSVNARSDSAWPGGRVRSDVETLSVASGTQLNMNVNEVISTGCDVQGPTHQPRGAQIESAHENCPIGMDRLGWRRRGTDPATENRSRS
jgi:hypothetical protein